MKECSLKTFLHSSCSYPEGALILGDASDSSLPEDSSTTSSNILFSYIASATGVGKEGTKAPGCTSPTLRLLFYCLGKLFLDTALCMPIKLPALETSLLCRGSPGCSELLGAALLWMLSSSMEQAFMTRSCTEFYTIFKFWNSSSLFTCSTGPKTWRV